MPGVTEKLVVPSPPVHGVRAHRLLRQLSEPARIQARGSDIEGVELLPPHAHPKSQPVPGPAGRVPANWESLLN
jgi:hypothetical protein